MPNVKQTLLCCLTCFGMTAAALGQAKTTASRLGDWQVGGGFSFGSSDYTVNKIRGFSFYSDFDLTHRYGVEVDFHQLNDPNSAVYERSYEVGGRYLLRRIGPLKPYVKGMYGRGVFNFPLNEANLAYNMFTGGGGADIPINERITGRADFEYQKWLSGPGISNGLTPLVFTFGAAYHFSAGKPR